MQHSQPREDFLCLVAAYEVDDEESIRRLSDRLRGLAQALRLQVQEDTSWDESFVEGFSEFPVVTQSFRVFVGDELLYEGDRQFGAALEDPTHTGFGARWAPIRIDGEEHAFAERALEGLGLEIDWPEVPPAR